MSPLSSRTNVRDLILQNGISRRCLEMTRTAKNGLELENELNKTQLLENGEAVPAPAGIQQTKENIR